MNRQEAAAELALVLEKLDPVMEPWGFMFASEGVRWSHYGAYGSGHYVRGETRIGLSCRATIDNLYYEHSFIKQSLCSRETERFTLGHRMLMEALDHGEDCQLVQTNELPDCIVARKGGDRVAALIHDWAQIAAAILCKPNERFDAIMRRGLRAWTIQ
jgi:hypothetical protein